MGELLAGHLVAAQPLLLVVFRCGLEPLPPLCVCVCGCVGPLVAAQPPPGGDEVWCTGVLQPSPSSWCFTGVVYRCGLEPLLFSVCVCVVEAGCTHVHR